MSVGKYSPTVNTWYAIDQKWWEKNGGNNVYDKDGFDQYGYNDKHIDRAGVHELNYMQFDEDSMSYLNFDRVSESWNAPMPTVGDKNEM